MTSLFEFYSIIAKYESELNLNSYYANEYRTIDALIQEFEGVTEPLSEIQNGKFVKEADEKAKFNYINNLSKNKIEEIIKIIDKQIGENNTNEGQILILKRVFTEIEWQIKQLENNHILSESFSFFKNDLINLKSQLVFKYQYLIPVEKEIENSKFTSTRKIKWNAGVANLGNLFSKLIFENKNSNNEAYISQPVNDVVDFIMEHFTDSKGEPFTRSSLIKYISDTKTGRQKRAKVKGDFFID